MPTVQSDMPQGVGAIWEIFNRLEYHSTSGSGRMLDGATFDREMVLDVTERKKLPIIQPKFFSFQEEMFPGGIDHGQATSGTTPIAPLPSLDFFLSTYRDNGWFRFDPSGELSADIKDYGAMEFAHVVSDAIETKADGSGVRDSLLNGYLAKPIEFNVVDSSDVTDLTWLVKLNLSMYNYPMCRGDRRNTKPPVQP